MHLYRLPNESPEYRKQREELLEAEVALRDQRERVAALRRALPRDTMVETDHVLREMPGGLEGDAPVREIKLSELVAETDHPLLLLHFMHGKAQASPCPMCTLWADGYDGVVKHLQQRANFAVLIAGDLASFSEYARSRGWRNVRILSTGDSSLKRDLGFENEDGSQNPGVSVFERSEDGAVRHFYSGGAMMRPGEFRGMDLMSPLWNFLDLTPEGRGDFMPQKSYD
jgi:predicted dithiol-disulfide oxidoreductase (DUF899 family)